jgi:hypothetical protein
MKGVVTQAILGMPRQDWEWLMNATQYIRRKEAASYLLAKYSFGAERTLAKGVVTGDTPAYHKAGRIVLYTREALDAWAQSKISPAPQSSSEARAA